MSTQLERVKDSLARTFPGAPADVLGEMLWDSVVLSEPQGTQLIQKDRPTAGVFFLLVDGSVDIAIDGASVVTLSAYDVVGEMALVAPEHSRCATVEVASPSATLIRCRLTSEQLESHRFRSVRRTLSRLAWGRFVANTARC